MDKRERSSNFTVAEIRTLVDIVSEYKHVVENKKTDAVGVREKNETWEKISQAFNSATGNKHRCSKTLKMKYDSLKKNLRKKAAENKKQLYMTGGGPIHDIQFTDYEEKLYDIIKINVEGLPARHDSDNLEHNIEVPVLNQTIFMEKENEVIVEVINNEIPDCFQLESIITANVDASASENSCIADMNEKKSATKVGGRWSENLKKRKSNVLNSHRSGTQTKFNELADVKKDLAVLQMETIRKENDTKVLILDLQLQKAQCELELIKKELEERDNVIKRNNEKHTLELKILEYDLKFKEMEMLHNKFNN